MGTTADHNQSFSFDLDHEALIICYPIGDPLVPHPCFHAGKSFLEGYRSFDLTGNQQVAGSKKGWPGTDKDIRASLFKGDWIEPGELDRLFSRAFETAAEECIRVKDNRHLVPCHLKQGNKAPDVIEVPMADHHRLNLLKIDLLLHGVMEHTAAGKAGVEQDSVFFPVCVYCEVTGKAMLGKKRPVKCKRGPYVN
jgi:hypothetical protein